MVFNHCWTLFQLRIRCSGIQNGIFLTQNVFLMTPNHNPHKISNIPIKFYPPIAYRTKSGCLDKTGVQTTRFRCVLLDWTFEGSATNKNISSIDRCCIALGPLDEVWSFFFIIVVSRDSASIGMCIVKMLLSSIYTNYEA